MDALDKYWDGIRQKVCTPCIDGDGSGGCRLSRGQECALKFYFPEIVKAIHAVRSNDVQPYADAIRLEVCASCKHQSTDGKCMLRTELDCGLDRYLPLVIEAVEKSLEGDKS